MSEPSEEEYREFVAKVEALPRSNKIWVLPIFAALADFGGAAKPKEVVKHIRERTRNLLSDGQWAYALQKKAINFSRNALRVHGGVRADVKGVWQWTALGERYFREHRDEDTSFPDDFPALPAEETGALDMPLETVDVTGRQAYSVPILRILNKGPRHRGEIIGALESVGRLDLLPGDRRLNREQVPIYRMHAGWMLSALKSDGHIRNMGQGIWEITQAGRDALKRDEPAWDVALYRGVSKARVRPLASSLSSGTRPASDTVAASSRPDSADSEIPVWDVLRWKDCGALISSDAYAAACRRLRPDLGPTPDGLRAPLARNLILYGPPGTGKTYTASKIAQSLTGATEPSDEGLFRILQFHPSYAYEDFVQGLRPDLSNSAVSYCIQSGPFRQICDDADDDPERFYVLVIDEINRGDPSRIFGEALFALEYRGQTVSLPIGPPLKVPPNLVVLGTMNSVDRSIALMDYALRRRFGFVYLPPDLEIIRKLHRGSRAAQRSVEAVEKLNQWLERRLGREHMIGHSFLLNPAYPVDERRSLDVLWEADIRPLLEEYLFHDHGGFAEVCDLWAEWTARPAKGPDDAS